MVEAPRAPYLRITIAALPVKAAYFTDFTPCARWRASVDLPVPAQPNRRNTCGPSLSFSQRETACSASSCCGDHSIRRCVVSTVPIPAIEPSSRSPFTTAPTPAGVPVKIRSPGNSSK